MRSNCFKRVNNLRWKSLYHYNCLYSISSSNHQIDRQMNTSIIDTQIKSTSSKRKSKPIPVSKLTESEAINELKELNESINFNDELYYNKNSPILPDNQYDKLIKRAENIIGRFPSLITLVSKLNTVGYSKSDSLVSLIHNYPMKSLDNGFQEQDILSFINKVINKTNDRSMKFIVEPKIDGLSLAIRYSDGQLVAAATRGNGLIGEDVLRNVIRMTTIPKSIDDTYRSIEIRGEVYVNKVDFSIINSDRINQSQSIYSTPRNLASGLLRSLTSDNNTQYLRFLAYTALTSDNHTRNYKSISKTQSESLQLLNELGFEVSNLCYTMLSTDDVISACRTMENRRDALSFEIDGAVVKVDRFDYHQIIGESTRAPKWAIAYKFTAKESTTKLIDIIVQVGRTGVLTPVAILEPVEIGGVVIERATLHNEAEVNRLRLSKGITVRVKRAGDVIPKIIRAESTGTHSTPYSLPSTCPSCGSDTIRDDNGTTVRCIAGLVCPAQTTESIKHFASRDAANIDGLGIAKIEELHEIGLVRNIADIYLLRDLDKTPTIRLNESTSLRDRKGWGDRSVNNLLTNIDNSRNISFHRLLYGLGIRHVGLNTAKALEKSFKGDFNKFWNYLIIQSNRLDSETDLSTIFPELFSIRDVGEAVVKSLVSFVRDANRRQIVTSLLEHLVISNFSTSNLDTTVTSNLTTYSTNNLSNDHVIRLSSSRMAGRVVVFTGKINNFTRSQLTDAVIAQGGSVRSLITNEVNLLVVSSTSSNSAKLNKAKDKKIDIWNEEQFLNNVLDSITK